MDEHELTEEVHRIRQRLHDLVNQHFTPLALRVAVLEAPPKRVNGTAGRLLWTLFGLATTLIILLAGAWAASITSRLHDVESAMREVATEQARRTNRIGALEEQMRDLRRGPRWQDRDLTR